ncbi:MAG: DNA polymerase III subunit beta [Candidatus Nealsonbacteria bacterium CG10_big_fil_rev_8_21_14_0_10_36_24]|uniref:Beta sliding clamp n=2 Tax=Parcubacteria group TaxID=1794811 RepID=A0A2M7B8E0_9BACT|nr:MAG: DNA polymerase III subunit beta [Candidatus Nealsonbacteria bacterium CG10_big_fil_rev_8_21_14_0_10_36_24]PIU99361.1 MAG: DNA polymerase III subunit beta [Candidatus Wolfebacteria bacterium CG03_land_8_20_14_0_80_36_15]
MKLIVLKTNLKEGLEKIERATSNNLILPILKNCLIESIDNKILFSATNLEIAITSFVSGKVIEEGALTAPVNTFLSIINNLLEERITIESENNNLIIKTSDYQAKIQGIKKEEFPIIPKISNNQDFIEIPSIILKEALESVIDSAQISGSRPELNGVLFDYQNIFLKIAATDSFRLSEKTINNSLFKSNIKQGFKIIIPIKTILEVIRLIKDTASKTIFYLDSNQVLFKIDDTEIISRLIDGEFPDYQVIIPQTIDTEIIIKKDKLINALKLVSIFTDRLNEIKISVLDNLKIISISSSSSTLGENEYLAPAKIKGQKVKIAFNWRFLLGGLKNIKSENVFLGFSGGTKPALIKSPEDNSYFYIVMPIKNSG